MPAWRPGGGARHEAGLLALAALALAWCLLRPTVAWQRALVDQVVVLDISQSMQVADVPWQGRMVSRLAAARLALRQVLPLLPCGSKIGWGVFTEHRSLLLLEPVEVCAHLDELRGTLDAIDHRMAWAGGSEVAKALHSALLLAAELPGPPALVFVSDGHEAPPLHPRHRPPFGGRPGAVAGLLVGVGGLVAQPIPKTDAAGRLLGTWAADEVLQTDPRSQGRGSSVRSELLVEDAPQAETAAAQALAPLLGAQPGSEHLSALHEPYLQLLAGELGLGYHRLADAPPAEGLLAALKAPALARPGTLQADARLPLALLALLLLLWLYRPWRGGGRGSPAG